MEPEASVAIAISDKHLSGEPVERRMALALDIQEAIIRHAGAIAEETIMAAMAKEWKNGRTF